jgi:ABC-type branched-subunit amino acid transport system substrate-binding protein
MIKNYFIPFLIFTWVITLAAQDTRQRERTILEKNIDLYKAGKYEKAEQNFNLIIDRIPNSVFITINYLMWAKSKYKLQDYKGALKISQDFLSAYPESEYRDDMLLVQGNSYFRLNRFETAVQAWLRAISISNDEILIQKLGLQITNTVRYKFDKPTFERVYAGLASADARLLFQIALAENEIQQGDKSKAEQIINNALHDSPDSRFTRRAESLLTGEDMGKNEMSLGLLLPLSGGNEKIGNEIKEGFDFAFQDYVQQNNSDLKLIVIDYGDELITAIQAYKQLAKNKGVLAVLGPIENDISAACAALSEYESLPIISPTATETDLTQLTHKFFQLNSSVSLRAEYLAHYAIDSLKLRRFATFAPLDNYFMKMVAKFVEDVQHNGGEIIDQEWYYPGDQDVNKQFMNLKRLGLRLAFADSVLKLYPAWRQDQVDSLYRKYQDSQYQKIREDNIKIDSADIAVKAIDGIFVPIFKQDLKFIAPQIAYSNIQAQYLGNGDWYDPDELKKNKNYINGLIFISDGYLNEENWDYKKFRNDYRMLTKKTPTIYNLVGYDCCRYMLRALKDTKDPMTRAEYLQNLRSPDKYDGLYRSIKIDSDQCNLNLRLLKYIYGQIIPLN